MAVPTTATVIPCQLRAPTSPVSDQMTSAAPRKEKAISIQCFPLMTWGDDRSPEEILLPSLAAAQTMPMNASWKMMVTTRGSIRVAAQTQKARSRANPIVIQNAGVRATSQGFRMRTGSPSLPQYSISPAAFPFQSLFAGSTKSKTARPAPWKTNDQERHTKGSSLVWVKR